MESHSYLESYLQERAGSQILVAACTPRALVRFQVHHVDGDDVDELPHVVHGNSAGAVHPVTASCSENSKGHGISD